MKFEHDFDPINFEDHIALVAFYKNSPSEKSNKWQGNKGDPSSEWSWTTRG